MILLIKYVKGWLELLTDLISGANPFYKNRRLVSDYFKKIFSNIFNILFLQKYILIQFGI